MLAFFQKITDVLNRLEIPYMPSGSVAMSIYIVPRATRNFDFIIHLEPGSIDDFIQNFQEGHYCDKDAIQDAVKSCSMFNIIDYVSGFKADFILLKNEAFRQEEFKRRRKIDFMGNAIYVATPEDLRISKFIWIQNIKELQLKIWLSKPPGERLRQFMVDNAALYQFWSIARKE